MSCPQCCFGKWQTREVVFDYLICKLFPQNYVIWVMHGETSALQNSKSKEFTQDTLPPKNPVELLINEAFHGFRQESFDVDLSQVVAEDEILKDILTSYDKDFFELLKDGREELYEGSKLKIRVFVKVISHKVFV